MQTATPVVRGLVLPAHAPICVPCSYRRPVAQEACGGFRITVSIITAVCAQFGMRLIATADACAPRAARGRARGRAAAPAVCHFSQSRSFIIFFVFNSLLCGYLVLGDSRFGLRRQKQPRARVCHAVSLPAQPTARRASAASALCPDPGLFRRVGRPLLLPCIRVDHARVRAEIAVARVVGAWLGLGEG